MKYYHIEFEDNRIVSCRETNERVSDELSYEHDNGFLNFVIVRADNESQARSKTKYLAIELMQQFGKRTA